MSRGIRLSDTEKLETVANAATAAGMTYGQYQQRHFFQETMTESKNKLHDMQPIFVRTTGKHICPGCAHPVVPHKNCGHCGKALIWKAGINN